jgi:hypothetical protein
MNQLLPSATVFAIVVTKIVDFVRNSIDADAKVRKWVWNVLALGLGLVIALSFGLNVFTSFSDNATGDWAGRILTGLSIGATGSGWHEFFDLLSSTAKAASTPK